MIHPMSDVQSKKIGKNTKVWQFCVILPEASIGSNSNICAHCFIENDVTIGNNVTIKSGVYLWDGVRIEDDVFVGPNVTFTNDKFPRSKKYTDTPMITILGKGSSIGAGATILPGVSIGERAMVGAGAVVTKSIPPMAIVVGNPAVIVGYVNAGLNSYKLFEGKNYYDAGRFSSEKTSVKDVALYHFPLINDIRGNLIFAEFEKIIPFIAKRFFVITNVPSLQVRGEHAHFKCHQFLICIKGSCSVVFDDGKNCEEVILDQPNKGVYLPPMTWAIQYKYTSDAVLLVFASDYYDNADYIRDYDNFLALVNHGK
jgi:UDP-2-acetamido-3-amino-2,3-dideoxy-glucuronate N-acetyltransferase